MSAELRAQISMMMSLKETDELLEIWQANDRVEWSDTAFEVIQEVLKERGVNIPEQHEPIYEHAEEKSQKKFFDFTEKELKIIDDEYPPDFYSPYEVFLTANRIDWMAKAMVVFIVVYNIFHFQGPLQIVRSYFLSNPNSVLIYALTTLFIAVSIVIGTVGIYFPLKALAYILRILMEMEHASRKKGLAKSMK